MILAPGGKIKMENSEFTIADIVTNEEDKKTLTPVPTKKKRVIIGTVNCDQLFLREEPDKESDILYVMHKGEAVSINLDESTSTFYKVTVSGAVGFCVKEFITIK